MRYSVIIAAQAKKDIRNIHEYITLELLSPFNADEWFRRIEKDIKSLSYMPLRHKVYEEEPWKQQGLRMMLSCKFVVLYYADKTAKTATVIRVMYGGRDILRQLSGEI